MRCACTPPPSHLSAKAPARRSGWSSSTRSTSSCFPDPRSPCWRLLNPGAAAAAAAAWPGHAAQPQARHLAPVFCSLLLRGHLHGFEPCLSAIPASCRIAIDILTTLVSLPPSKKESHALPGPSRPIPRPCSPPLSRSPPAGARAGSSCCRTIAPPPTVRAVITPKLLP